MKNGNPKNHPTPGKTEETTDHNKHNLLYFEHNSMQGLFNCMDKWQKENKKRLLSLCIQRDRGKFCCIALTNPTEVIIKCGSNSEYDYKKYDGAHVSSTGALSVNIEHND